MFVRKIETASAYGERRGEMKKQYAAERVLDSVLMTAQHMLANHEERGVVVEMVRAAYKSVVKELDEGSRPQSAMQACADLWRLLAGE